MLHPSILFLIYVATFQKKIEKCFTFFFFLTKGGKIGLQFAYYLGICTCIVVFQRDEF